VSPEPFVAVAHVADVKPGHPLTVTVDGREIALFNVAGTVYALDNACPHQGAPLADGWIDGATVTCTWHAWCFNLGDGRMTHGGFTGVDVFDVKIEDELVLVSRAARPKTRS
jgi:nitrite reductase/ring-hydroxylating ferredoxin subunit